MDEWQLDEKFLGFTVSQLMGLVVPFASLKEETVDVTSTGRCFLDISVLDIVADDVIVGDSIDGNLVLSGIVLEGTSEESLGEEESREPELNRSTLSNPIVQEVDSVIGIHDPRSKGLER